MRLSQINERKIRQWSEDRNLDKLKEALGIGTFQHRITILRELGNLHAHEVRNDIEQLLDDKVRIVSETAMQTLEKLGVDSQQKAVIEAKRRWWNQHEADLDAHSEKQWATSEEEEQEKLRIRLAESSLSRARIAGNKIHSSNRRSMITVTVIASAVAAFYYLLKVLFNY